MTKFDIIKQLTDTIQVSWVGYGKWKITGTLQYPDRDGTILTKELSLITHNEEDNTGLFDGELFNELCGFNTFDELDEAARQECITAQEFQRRVWRDTANEDNYEPRRDRDFRLANKLFDFSQDL